MSTADQPFLAHWSLDSTFNAIEPVCRELASVVQRNGFGHVVFQTDLVLREAFTNALCHGNHFDPAKNVECSIRLDGNVLTIVITDEGNGFDWRKACYCGLNDELKESGRGLPIYFMYTDEVLFNEKGNRVLLKKRLLPEGELPSSPSPLSAMIGLVQPDVTVTLDGNLTATDADTVRMKLAEIIEKIEPMSLLSIDFSRTVWIDSMGLSVLVWAYKNMQEKEGHVRLCKFSKQIETLFRQMNFDKHFDIE